MAQHHKREIVPLSALKPAPYNPREIDAESMHGLSKSLERYGVVQEIVANKRTGHIVSGHQRAKALAAAGETEAPVCWVDLDDADERALNIAMNSQHITGHFTPDVKKLIDEIAIDIPDVVDMLRLDLIAQTFNAASSDTSANEPQGSDGGSVEASDDTPDSEPGRVYQLGPHRVVCGDSQNSDVIDLLMKGKRAALVVTDPPYNIAEHGTNFAENLTDPRRPNDANTRGSGAAYRELVEDGWDSGYSFRDSMAAIDRATGDDASIYVFTSHFLLSEVMEEIGEFFRYTNLCVWSKPNPMPSLAKRHWTWGTELVAYGTRGRHTFNFPDVGHAHNVWNFKSIVSERRHGEALHPTQKPIDVIEHPIKHSSNAGDLVIDLFLGSGTTLIACARLGRTCYGVEREPKYVDVIRKRWGEWARSVNLDPGPDAL